MGVAVEYTTGEKYDPSGAKRGAIPQVMTIGGKAWLDCPQIGTDFVAFVIGGGEFGHRGTAAIELMKAVRWLLFRCLIMRGRLGARG